MLKGAAESLLLPLSSRALEAGHHIPILRDRKAVELLGQLNFDASSVARNSLYHTIICLRTRRFDAVVAQFLNAHPRGTIVNLGCGLDTRFERLDNGCARWLEVDFAPVIALRRKLLTEEERRVFFPCSITNPSWLDKLQDFGTQPVLFLAEGVLMFLDPSEVDRLLAEIIVRFPNSRILFDAVKPIEVTLRRYHPTLRRTGAALRWGLRNARTLLGKHPSLELSSEWFYCDEPEPRLGWYRLLRYMPWLGRTAWILQFDVRKTLVSKS